MPNENTIGLYGQSLFNSSDNNTNIEYRDKLMNCGFNTLILFALHVDESFRLWWGNNPMAADGRLVYRTNRALPDLLRDLRDGGGFHTILFSIGGAGTLDWHHIEQALGTGGGRAELTANFRAVAEWLPLDGFDFDPEEDNILTQTVATTAGLLAPMGGRNIITGAPFNGGPLRDWWLNILRIVFDTDHRQLVDWWNLQVYGSPADPRTWLAAVEADKDTIGVKDPAAFIQPGFAAYDGTPDTMTPDQMRQALIGYSDLRLSGAFVWQARTFLGLGSRYSAQEYAAALRSGLSGGLAH